jgi:formate hydrogenlyase transcriptional activator
MRVAMRSPSVGNDSEILSAAMLETRCETLFRVSKAFAAHGDPKELFGVLANELHRVVQFDFIGVSFRNKDSDTFQNYFVDMTSRSELVPDEQLTPEETLTLRVYERQEPLLRSTDELEPRYGRLQAMLKRLHIRSICALPLTTAHRKLGAITFGSRQVDTYSPDEVRLVSEVAGYIALAFDDALNLAALRPSTSPIRLSQIWSSAICCVPFRKTSGARCSAIMRACRSRIRTTSSCDSTRLTFRGEKGSCRKI